jgi:M6 family metalloprotease-like protein
MKEKMTNGSLMRTFLCLAFLFASVLVYAFPHNGEIYSLRQPDGTFVDCKVFGDEFYQDVETPDGYTLIRDSGTGWICYAKVSADGSSYVSTGVVYASDSSSAANTKAGLSKKIRIKKEAVEKARKHNRDILFPMQPAYDASAGASSGSVAADAAIQPAPPSITVMSGTYTGLTLLIDFPDKRGTIARQDIDNFCNQTGYTGYSNNGSVRDYFSAISDGVLTYVNKVADYVTTANNFSYYDQNCDYCMVQELVNEVLNKLKNTGFDFSGLSTTGTQFTAINILYAGAPTQGWAKGLWPHSGSLNGSFSVNGIKAVRYQLSNIGTELTLDTYTHENGHMLLGWPDVYAYDNHDNGVGYYEEGTNSKNPSMRNPYFRYLKGWCKITDISNASAGSVFTLGANVNQACYYSNRSDGTEFFLIEVLRKTGRNASLPDEGLAIWHVNLNGDNTTSSKPNLISIEQADGKAEIENMVNNGGPGDLFHSGDKTAFNDNTNPSAKWTDGTVSGIDINSVSALGDPMSFTFKTGSPATPDPTAVPTSAPSPVPTATILRGDVNSSGGVDIVDALLIAQYYVGLAPAAFASNAADVNCSGAIDIVDALLIAQFYVGLISQLPC